jgi:hypothetical protein
MNSVYTEGNIKGGIKQIVTDVSRGAITALTVYKTSQIPTIKKAKPSL